MPATTPTATELCGCAAAALLLSALARPAAAVDLPALLACRDLSALDAPAEALADALRAIPDARCKRIDLRGRSATECDLERPLDVFGLPVREFSIAHGAGRGERARSVFRASASRLAQAAERALRTPLAARPDGSFVADVEVDPPRRISVSPREDGASVFLCEPVVRRESPEDILAGVDSARGGIAGRVSFPDGSLPPMRVCAVPRDPWLRSRCTLTVEGRADYLITGLAPGDYDVVSYALAGNSNGLVGAHARRLEDCAPNAPGCAGGILVPRTVRAGEVVTDVDPDRFYTDLPARFDIVRRGESD